MSELNNWFTPAAFVAVSLLFGVLIEKVVLSILKKNALRTKWEGDEIVIDSLKGTAWIVCLLAGVFGAVQISPLNTRLFLVIEDILLVLFILALTVVCARIGSGLVTLFGKRAQGGFPSASIYGNIVGMLVFALGLLTILHTLGVSITPALAALGVGGLAVALALQDPLANLFSGLQIIASRQVSRGDYVRLQTGEEGSVADITWRNTLIVGTANHTIIIPNSKMATNIITNYDLPQKEVVFSVPVRVAYGSDLNVVERVSVEVATGVMKDVAGGVPEHQPLVRFASFGETGIQFNVVLRAREFSVQAVLTHELVKRLNTRFRQEGIETPVALAPKK